MRNLSNSVIERILEPYGVRSDHTLYEQIGVYVEILLYWNRKISLTSVTNPEEIVKFHFGESFFASSVVPIHDGRLADVGSGAGFPGIPLRMVKPGLDLTLIESNAKKCAFMSEVVRRLNLDHVNVVHSRMESVHSGPNAFDFIAARAIGRHNELLSWAMQRLTHSGTVLIWVGEDDARELSHNPDWLWQTPALIPGSRRRYILAGSPK